MVKDSVGDESDHKDGGHGTDAVETILLKEYGQNDIEDRRICHSDERAERDVEYLLPRLRICMAGMPEELPVGQEKRAIIKNNDREIERTERFLGWGGIEERGARCHNFLLW